MRRVSRREFMATGAAAAAAIAGGPALGQNEGRRPNIILIMADDLSAKELGCHGHPEFRTPNLDRLATEGVAFSTCWATPICSPSRALIMTGRYGFRTGWFHNNLRTPEPLCQGNETIGQVMQTAGYRTCVVGKWQIPGLEPEHGFDEAYMWLSGHPLAKRLGDQFDGPVEETGNSLPGRTARYWHPAIVQNEELVDTGPEDYGPDLFVDYLNGFAQRNRERPFFAYFPMCLPHKSWDFDRDKAGYLPPPKLNDAGERVEGQGEPTLQANVEYIDHLVGRIVSNLEEQGLRENTVIMFTCDNGTSGYGKARVEEEKGARVPLIVNGPGVVKPLGMRGELASFADILPTCAELGRAELPAHEIDGRSFAPLLRGEAYEKREWLFSYYAVHRMLRTERWLLDGNGRLWDCGDGRDEEGYLDVTDSDDAEVAAARARFDELLEELPGPPEAMRAKWEARKA